jgi:hypothetical protein
MKNKLWCRIFPFVLMLISAVISGGIFYLDEGSHTFAFFCIVGIGPK